MNYVKLIRTQSNMSQEVFAKELGTTPISINRWENGKAVPNSMAQKQLYDFCVRHGIDASGFIARSFERQASSDKLVLYHASRSGIEGPIAPISRSKCDFGRGFYMGTSTLQPLTLVCAEERPKLYSVEFDLSGLKVLNLDIDMEWAMLIAYNRSQLDGISGSALYNKYASMSEGYDVVTGYIADDRMYSELTNFFNGNITDVALVSCLAALELGRQYVAITEKACRQIKVLEERTLAHFELAVLRDKSSERRKEGLALSDEAVRKHRREGMYFDEILKASE